MSSHFDIIIVGGGPAGSACGTMLARAGLRVLILEKTKFPREKICGACVNPRAWQYFEHLGVADELRAQTLNTIDSFRVTSNTGSSFAGQIPVSTHHQFFSIARSELDSILLKQASRSGVEVLEETAVIDIRRETCWTIVAPRGNDVVYFTCDILVGADGRNSLVARKTPEFLRRSIRARIRESAIRDGRVGVQWHTGHQPRLGSAVEMFLFGSGYGGIVNIDAQHANVALVTSHATAQLAYHDFPRFLEETMYNNPSAKEKLKSLTPDGEIHTAATITPRTNRSAHPNALLIGDARQTVEPFTGEGILFALQDAWIAARSILGRYNRNGLPRIHPYNRFIANSFLSMALRRPFLAQQLTGIGSVIPSVTRPVLRSLFGM